MRGAVEVAGLLAVAVAVVAAVDRLAALTPAGFAVAAALPLAVAALGGLAARRRGLGS
jgi:hypothetical protein